MQLIAPAKLTTSLRITGMRDDGFHLIDAEMVSLDFADVLTVENVRPETDGGTTHVRFTGPHAITPEPGSQDLVARALVLVGRTASVQVDKQVPAGGGLGGGSSDAAAILRWAGHRDLAGAAALGADVAYCLVGGRARVRGIGEIVEPLPFVAETFTILVPPFGCSTPAVYSRWDDLGCPEGPTGNDLEPAALSLEPRLVHWRDLLGNATGQVPRLAGSGSTWFVEGAFPGDGRIVTATVPA